MNSILNNKRFTRREFINYLITLLSIPAVLWWLFVGRRNEKSKRNTEKIIIGQELPSGVNLFGTAILVNNASHTKAFEAKCTHLGCQIKKLDGEAIVCQCHGSRFDLSGIPIKGPAKESLRELKIGKDLSGNYFIYQ
jgi:Rieske Fe-S protein